MWRVKMNTDLYDAGRSYYTPKEDSVWKPADEKKAEEKQKRGGDKVSKSTEIFKKLVVLIASKSIDQIEATESEGLISSLKSRRTGQTGDPERLLIDKAIQKVREREEMTLNRSVLPSASQRHQKNIDFLENVMEANQIQGATSRALLYNYLEKFYDLCNSLANKSVDKIERSEVELYISLALQIKKLTDNLKVKQENIFNDLPHLKLLLVNEPRTFVKVLEREEMALNQSTLESSKERHQRNIGILNLAKGNLLSK